MKIKKGDKVIILSGKDKGKTVSVDKVFPGKDGRGSVLLSGANMFKKHQKPRGEGRPGGIVEVLRPLAVGKVALVCPKCGKPTRVGYKKETGAGKKEGKVRICRKCKNFI